MHTADYIKLSIVKRQSIDSTMMQFQPSGKPAFLGLIIGARQHFPGQFNSVHPAILQVMCNSQQQRTAAKANFEYS